MGPSGASSASVVNDPGLRANILVSIREDGLAMLDRFQGEIPALFDNYLRLEHLDQDAAREAIVGPKDKWNELAPPEAAFDVERRSRRSGASRSCRPAGSSRRHARARPDG